MVNQNIIRILMGYEYSDEAANASVNDIFSHNKI